jgi:hypothetical protein
MAITAQEQQRETVTLLVGQRWRGVDELADVSLELGGAECAARVQQLGVVSGSGSGE